MNSYPNRPGSIGQAHRIITQLKGAIKDLEARIDAETVPMVELGNTYPQPGAGCRCNAYCERECCCDVDWTDPLVYHHEDTIRVLTDGLYTMTGCLYTEDTNSAAELLLKSINYKFPE